MQIEKTSPTVFTPLEDGTAVLLNLNTLFYYSLNRTGAALWQQIEKNQTVSDGDMVQAICNRFDVDQDLARQTLKEFLGQLEQFKMIRIL